MYEYRVKVLGVIDGDTISAEVDLGLRVFVRLPLRLLGVNAPELRSSNLVERERAKAAKAYVFNALCHDPSTEVKVQTHKPDARDKYGRWLGKVCFRYRTEHEWSCLNDDIVRDGFAVVYDGGTRKSSGRGA